MACKTSRPQASQSIRDGFKHRATPHLRGQPPASARNDSRRPETGARGANLNGADLRFTDLSVVHLEGAQLSSVTLLGAHLEGADLDQGQPHARQKGASPEKQVVLNCLFSFLRTALHGADPQRLHRAGPQAEARRCLAPVRPENRLGEEEAAMAGESATDRTTPRALALLDHRAAQTRSTPGSSARPL